MAFCSGEVHTLSSGEMEVALSSKPRPAEEFMRKNRLQEYTQRSALPLPVYQTVSEGPPHAPQFWATVIVDGMTFDSSQSFSSRKEAEQHVAKMALEGISRKIQEEGCPLIHADTTFCKSILYEYAVKMNLEKPTYTCSLLEGLVPTFISSVSFAGKVYMGVNGRNKKEAQQLGARAAIESILGDCNPSRRTLMSQIIKSKGKLYATISQMSGSISPVVDLASEDNPENVLGNNLVRGKEPQPALANESLPAIGHIVPAPPRQVSETCPTNVEGMKPEEEYIHEGNSGSTGNGILVARQLQDGPQSVLVNMSSHTIADIKDSNVSPLMHLASGDGSDRGKEVQSALTNERPLAAGHLVAAPSKQISEACPMHADEMKPKAEYMCEVNSYSIESGTSLARQLQDGPMKNNGRESALACHSLGEPIGIPISPHDDSPGFSVGTREMSSNSKKKRPKKGRGEWKGSKSKKSRASGVGCS